VNNPYRFPKEQPSEKNESRRSLTTTKGGGEGGVLAAGKSKKSVRNYCQGRGKKAISHQLGGKEKREWPSSKVEGKLSGRKARPRGKKKILEGKKGGS